MSEARPPLASEGTAPAAAPNLSATIDKKKSIIFGLIGIFFIVLIFWRVIPQVGSYSEAASALENMTPIALAVIGLAVLLYLFAYGWPFVAAAPGLSYWHGQSVNQSAFAISNGVPAGGAFGLAVQYAMLTSYRVTPTASTAAITTVGLWSTFVTLALPIMGVVALVIAGENSGSYQLGALLGLAALIAAVVVFVLIIRSEPLATKVGRAGNAVMRPVTKRIGRLKDLDLVPLILKFRGDIYGLVKARWAAITGAQLAVSFTQFLILYVALRGVQGWDNAGQSWLVVFAAFAISQLGLMIPITPGGLGTVDAAMIGLLTTFGVSDGDATAADLVWRATSYIPQIVIGIVCLVLWYVREGKRLATVSTPTTPAAPAA